uniref:Uncharacterized protein n=1 Tax=Clastoptera arizonana TaxID=38151 RepID=A0A1B6CGM0_9HEMI
MHRTGRSKRIEFKKHIDWKHKNCDYKSDYQLLLSRHHFDIETNYYITYIKVKEINSLELLKINQAVRNYYASNFNEQVQNHFLLQVQNHFLLLQGQNPL